MAYRRLLFLVIYALSTPPLLHAEDWEEDFSYSDFYTSTGDAYIDDFAYTDDEDYGMQTECNLCECCTQDPLFHQFAIGPLVYSVTRNRIGGSRQSGTLYGFRACYDRIKRYGIYWGAEYWYGKGVLEGVATNNNTLRSNFSDQQIEGRIGFTFQGLDCHHPSVTPYIGYGFFDEINHYRPPTPITPKFHNKYGYIAVGFLSSLDINHWLRIGLNFKGRLLWDAPHCEVSEDPEFPSEDLLVGTRFQYRAELPLLYQSNGECHRFGFGIVPFFERRHYGGRENHPHDFFDTRLTIYGVILEATYQL